MDIQAVYAGFWRRAWAVFIDVVLDLVFASVLWSITGGAWAGWLFMAFLLIHHVGLAAEGGTIGKRVLGLRIVSINGARLDLPHALVREVVRLTGSLLSLGLGFLWMLDERQRRAWHDLAAGSIVVRELRGVAAPAWRFNPPWAMASINRADEQETQPVVETHPMRQDEPAAAGPPPPPPPPPAASGTAPGDMDPHRL